MGIRVDFSKVPDDLRAGRRNTTLTIRIEPALKKAAERRAAARDETLSQIVRRSLRTYVQGHEPA